MKLLERVAEIKQSAQNATDPDDEFVLCTLALCRVVPVLVDAVQKREAAYQAGIQHDDGKCDWRTYSDLVLDDEEAHKQALALIYGEEETPDAE